jgi:hypothetical protein
MSPIFKRSAVVCQIVLSLFLLSTQPAGARTTILEPPKTQQDFRQKVIKKGTGPKARVTVKLTSDVVYKGYIREANDTEFVVIDNAGGAHSIKYADVRSIGGSGLSTGAKIAIGIGIGAGAVLAVLAAVVASDN